MYLEVVRDKPNRETRGDEKYGERNLKRQIEGVNSRGPPLTHKNFRETLEKIEETSP